MRDLKSLIVILSIIVLTVAIMSFLWRDNLFTTSALTILSVGILLFWNKIQDIFRYSVAAVGGTTAEVVCIYFGVWTYSNPTYIIPIWLPLVWGLTGIISGRLVDYFLRKGGKK
jgi:hypothetical protein